MQVDNGRVVITGLGVVSSIGTGRKEFWNNLIGGKCGISQVSSFDTAKFRVHKGGEVKNFNKNDFLSKRSRNRKEIGRASQFAIASTRLAIEDAKLDLNKLNRERVAVFIGTTMGEAQAIEKMDSVWLEEGEEKVESILVQQYTPDAIPSNVSHEFSVKGPTLIIPTACAAGNYCIGYGYDLIRQGKADVVIAGGADAFSRIAFVGFNRLFAMAPEKCQPFDKNRKGMMLGEGSAILILESLQHALDRDAAIYAEIKGYGLSCDAYNMTIPSVEGILKVIKKALNNASVRPEAVNYISAHGTGTVQNDKVETQAIKETFGEHAKSIAVSSIKSMLGHTMGTASALEAISCCLAIREQVIPPTINFETADPECDIDCVPNKARKAEVNVALNNSFAFGGNNACLVLEKYE